MTCLSAAPPEVPVSLMASSINRTTADVSWVITMYVYGRETYVVRYGTNPDVLDMETEIVFGGLDTSETDQFFSVSLERLQPYTTYYFSVLATNILATTTSDVASFTTSI